MIPGVKDSRKAESKFVWFFFYILILTLVFLIHEYMIFFVCFIIIFYLKDRSASYNFWRCPFSCLR